MRLLDTIFALLAIVCFVGFLGILAYHVPEPALLCVLGIVSAMALFDFARSFRTGDNGTR